MKSEIKDRILKEIKFTATRSSGPGGQNVNKVSTKVELRFNVDESIVLTDHEKFLLNLKLSNKISMDGEFIITNQTSRSQLKNKEAAITHFFTLIEQALKKPKRRIATKPTKQSKRKRLDDKKHHSTKKQLRQKYKD